MPYMAWASAGAGDVVGVAYWNSNGKGIAIVAVKGSNTDWAAYAGADDGWSERECIEWTVRHGAKLSQRQAAALFPHLPLESWRR